ncbi:hypothetical protein BGZ65_010296, partial [Modicella reniformis]
MNGIVVALRLTREGQSTRQVAKTVDLCLNSVRRIHLWNKENVPMNSGGRPRKLDESMVNPLKLNLKRGFFKSAVQATKEADKLRTVPVSVYTFNRQHLETFMRHRLPRRNPLLKTEYKEDRMKFVNKYEQWEDPDWKRVIFT